MNIKEPAAKGVARACSIFLQDLQALPEEAFDRSFGGKARTVADIVYEVNLVNDQVEMVIRGVKPLDEPDEGWVKAPEGCRDKETVINGFRKSSERIIATIEALTEHQMEEPILDDGKETTSFERCRFVTLHVWYHSGQLNFIQTLLGDDGWHWT